MPITQMMRMGIPTAIVKIRWGLLQQAYSMSMVNHFVPWSNSLHLKRLKTLDVIVGWRKKSIKMIETMTFLDQVILNRLQQIAKEDQNRMKNKMTSKGERPVSVILVKVVQLLMNMFCLNIQSNEIIIIELFWTQLKGLKTQRK